MTLIGDGLALISGNLWKYATIGVGGVSLIGGAVLGVELVEAHHQRDSYQKQMVKAVARATQDEANISTLQASISTQNADIEALSRQSATAVAASTKVVAVYQTQAPSVQKSVSALAAPLAGKTSCDRMQEADSRILKDLGQ